MPVPMYGKPRAITTPAVPTDGLYVRLFPYLHGHNADWRGFWPMADRYIFHWYTSTTHTHPLVLSNVNCKLNFIEIDSVKIRKNDLGLWSVVHCAAAQLGMLHYTLPCTFPL